jgi:hypothetical protein
MVVEMDITCLRPVAGLPQRILGNDLESISPRRILP